MLVEQKLYDGNGNVTRLTDAGYVTTFLYDDEGNLYVTQDRGRRQRDAAL